MKTSRVLVVMRVVVLCCLLSVSALAKHHTSEQRDSTYLPDYVRNPEYTLTGIGLYGSAEIGLHRSRFASFADLPTCCTSNYGDTVGFHWSAGMTFDQSLTNWLLLDLRLGVNAGRVKFSRVDNLLVGSSSWAGIVIPIRNTTDIQFFSINLEPALKMRLLPVPITTTYAPSLYLLAGIGIRYYTQSIFSYEESVTSDTINFLLPNNRVSAKRNVITNTNIPLFNQLQVMPFLGLESEIFIQNEFPSHWLLVPYMRYYFALNDMADELVARKIVGNPPMATYQLELGSWRMDALQAGLTLKYRMFSLVK